MGNTKVLQFVRNHHVLLVDDDDLVRHGLTLALMSNGFMVQAVPTAEEAVKVLRHKRFHSIVCDFNLPGMNGLEFFTHIKTFASRSTNILITAFGVDNICNSAEAAGIHAFFEKPFTINALIACLNAGIGNSEGNPDEGSDGSDPSD